MPIRFRCAYCNQLMGIGRRKAGTVVRCPRCAGELIVPGPNGMADPGDESGALEPADISFDAPAPETPGNPLSPAPTYEHAPLSAQALAPPPIGSPSDIRKPGLYVPHNWLVTAGVVAGAVVLVIFVLGFLIGRWSH